MPSIRRRENDVDMPSKYDVETTFIFDCDFNVVSTSMFDVVSTLFRRCCAHWVDAVAVTFNGNVLKTFWERFKFISISLEHFIY